MTVAGTEPLLAAAALAEGVASEASAPTPKTIRTMTHLGLCKKVQNTGSTARDHLANERTFLAWLRTSISMVSFGIGIAKFSPTTWGLTFGIVFVLVGSVILIFSSLRYYNVMHTLERGEFSINTGGILVLVGMVMFLTAMALLYIVVVIIRPKDGAIL
eukprot:CAMPEP_0195055622 /NCGR_PEP_ID=MMETSP0448-20130528/4250_1 /TAXON_ID=66468 /ORGANISM="Heterocapsa triquestra, Strain CCMP 448" /LENGTH=158 /DNA_ID=CAMNT_0040085301 /DNA_START=16 /DNA_END=492 /DNA_ORIENTATION=-